MMTGSTASPNWTSSHFGQYSRLVGNQGCWRTTRDQLDLAAGMNSHAGGEIGDGDVVHGADVIDAEMLAFVAHHQDAADEVVDMAEAAGLATVALQLERQLAGLVLVRERLQP